MHKFDLVTTQHKVTVKIIMFKMIKNNLEWIHDYPPHWVIFICIITYIFNMSYRGELQLLYQRVGTGAEYVY